MKRALGIDHGDVRIGLALSDELRMLAHPLETIAGDKDAVSKIVKWVTEKCVDAVVIGFPKNMNGTKGPAAQKVEAFAEVLRGKLPEGVRVVLWDERTTTQAAQKSLHEVGRNVKNSRGIIDQVAAQLILQGWLDAQGFTM